MVRKSFGAINHGQMLVGIDWVEILLLIDGLHGLLNWWFFLLLIMGVDTRNEKTIAIILNVLDLGASRILFRGSLIAANSVTALKDAKVAHFDLKLLSRLCLTLSRGVILTVHL